MADKLHTFVWTLKDRTDEGRVNWEPTIEEGVYQAAFPNYVVKISTRPNHQNPDEVDIWIAIINIVGTVIEEFADITLAGTGFREPYALMQDLYRLARRRAMGLDKALDDILASLGPAAPPSEGSNQGITDDDVPF
jgi:hypothetical protein